MTQIIGITGIKGSGKSTLASMLAELIPDAEIVAFADALRDDAHWLLQQFVEASDRNPKGGWTIQRPWLEEHKGTIFGPILQGLGEFARQWFGGDYWIKEHEMYADQFPFVIAPDVRYPNEVEYIHSKGGLLVAIHGPSRWEGDARDASHPSETSVKACREMADFRVYNSEGLDDLKHQATLIVDYLLPNLDKIAAERELANVGN